MKYRTLDPNGDYTFGATGEFLINSPEAVAQAILTRLRLVAGEWFLDVTEGTPYKTEVLGYNTQGTRDLAIKNRILSTPGVTDMIAYSSSVTADRKMFVSARVNTQYGPTSINTTF